MQDLPQESLCIRTYTRTVAGDESTSLYRTVLDEVEERILTEPTAATKWMETRRHLCEGNVVLMQDKSRHRNDWPLGRVLEVMRSDDGRVGKVNVDVAQDGERKT